MNMKEWKTQESWMDWVRWSINNNGLTEFSKNVIERRNPVLSDNTSRYSAQFLDE